MSTYTASHGYTIETDGGQYWRFGPWEGRVLLRAPDGSVELSTDVHSAAERDSAVSRYRQHVRDIAQDVGMWTAGAWEASHQWWSADAPLRLYEIGITHPVTGAVRQYQQVAAASESAARTIAADDLGVPADRLRIRICGPAANPSPISVAELRHYWVTTQGRLDGRRRCGYVDLSVGYVGPVRA